MRLPTLPTAALIATLLLAGCASQPLYAPATATVNAMPAQVAATPEHYHGEVIWGGSVVAVRNLGEHSEIEIFAYPLDAAQHPRRDDAGGGRFIAIVPGYVERIDYPTGAMITLRGMLAGVRSGRVGEAPYVFPLVNVDASHLWTEQELRDRPRVHFGVGIGVGIR